MSADPYDYRRALEEVLESYSRPPVERIRLTYVFALASESLGRLSNINTPEELEQTLHDMSFYNMCHVEDLIKRGIQEAINNFDEIVTQGEHLRRLGDVNDRDLNILILRAYDTRMAKRQGESFLAALQIYRHSISAPRNPLSTAFHRLRHLHGQPIRVTILDVTELEEYLELVPPNERVSTMDSLLDVVREHVHIKALCESPENYTTRAIHLPKLDDPILHELQAFAQRMSRLPPELHRIAASENDTHLQAYMHMYMVARGRVCTQ